MRSKQATAGHAAGIYSDMTLDGPEIGTLVAVVDRAKNLPNRRTIGKQDPYCAMRLGKDAKKTNTDRRGGQTPKWDQELRFTVHDSPDYYKLKLSVFNDDKKTDLIGEAWIDLTSVVKLGGGQADVWQQLSFKGKYAGEVRIELTFYDTRENPQEKRRTKERSQTGLEDSSSDNLMPAQRSLGPREIKRRPLPAGPTATTSSAQVSTLPEPMDLPPLRPPKEPLNEQPRVHAPVPCRPRTASASPQPEQAPDQYHMQPQDQQEQYNYLVSDSHPFEQPDYEYSQSGQQALQLSSGQSYDNYQPDEPDFLQQYDQSGYEQDGNQSYMETFDSRYLNGPESWQDPRPLPMHMQSEPVTPQYSTPLSRPMPPTNNSDSQLQHYRPHPQSTAQANNQDYTGHLENNFRRSWAHYDVPQSPLEAPRPGPPVPPKHKETPPSRVRNDFPPSAYTPQPLRVNQKRAAISERSPLQTLEDGYDRRQDTWQLQGPPQRHSMYAEPHGLDEIHSNRQMQLYDHKRRHDTLPSTPELRGQPQQYQNSYRRNSYNSRQPSFGQYMTEEPEFASPNGPGMSSYIAARQPTVQDAPPSPGLSPSLQPALARKAVGDQPKRLSTAPFGPDSYDVLNPSSSPVTNEGTPFQTPEQAKEAARLREVQKMRELGPIIGNDGREIDPSDHLPSDTWAPEPEWKNKKPEHVVHIRSKNGANKPAGARASPLVIRHNHHPTSSQSTPASASPAILHTPNSAGNRNKLQKPTSARPLPSQPYSSPLTSIQPRHTAAALVPAVASSPNHVHFDESPHYQQKFSHTPRLSFDNRPTDQRNRPALSEYQVVVGNGNRSRGPSYTRPHPPAPNDSSHITPTKYGSRQIQSSPPYQSPYDAPYENQISPIHSVPRSQQQSQQYFDDPLAAEMSLIDIGPSRTEYQQGSFGRSMVRSRGVR